MDFTPADYAKIIGITSSPDGFTTSLPSQEQIRKLAELEQRIHEKTTHLSGVFYETFASRPLPSFLRTFFNTPWDFKSEFFEVLRFSFKSMISGVAFSRRRENLDEVALFLVVQLSRLDVIFNDFFFALEPPVKDIKLATLRYDSLLRELGLFALTSEVYLINQHHLQPTAPPFTPPSDLLQHLQYWRHNANHLLTSTFVSYQHSQESESRLAYKGLVKFVKVLESGSLSFGEDYVGLCDLLWWKCDVFADRSGTTHPPCVEGVNFMCSNCRAVRYCCRDHQKLRWKEHKLICSKPSW